MRQSMGTDTLTDLDLVSAYYAAFQPAGLKGKYRQAFIRLAMKCDNQRRLNRRRGIRQAGIRAGKSKSKNTPPIYQGQMLGGMESMTFYDGVASVRGAFVNPYRKDFSK